jgi:maleamate amidohydrolase
LTPDLNQEMEDVIAARRDLTPRGAGTRPAVVVVDFQRAFTETPRCGQPTIDALTASAELLAAARDADVSVIYLTVIYDDLSDIPLSWRPDIKGDGISKCLRGWELTAIHPLVAPQLGDIILEKHHASGFFGTDLDGRLTRLGVDTLLVVGTSTSGCVRATAIDGAARSYRVQVIEECVDDFRLISGEAALDDIAERYGDVISLKGALDYLASFGAAEPVTPPPAVSVKGTVST